MPATRHDRPSLPAHAAPVGLDVDTNTTANGNVAQLWTCGTATGQTWSMGADGTVRAFGKCLDVDANGTANHSGSGSPEVGGTGHVRGASRRPPLLHVRAGRRWSPAWCSSW